MEQGSQNNNTLAKGFGILALSGLLVKVISLLYAPLLNIILGAEGMGAYSVTYNIYSYFFVITTAGLTAAVSKSVSELHSLGHKKDVERLFRVARQFMFLLGVATFAIMFIFAVPLAHAMKSPDSALAIRVLSPSLMITALMCAYRGYFQGKGIMTPTGVSQIIEQILNLVFSLSVAYFIISRFGEGAMAQGVAGATSGTIAGAVGALIILVMLYRKHSSRMHLEGENTLTEKELLRKLIMYAGPITLAVAIQNLGFVFDPMVVRGRLAGIGFEKAAIDILYGYFFQYNQLIMVPITITMYLATTLLPSISGLVAVKDYVQLKVSINQAFRLAFLVSIPAAVGLAVLSSEICIMLGYTENVAYLISYGTIVVVLTAITQVQTSILQGLSKLHVVTVFAGVSLVVRAATSYIFVGIPSVNIFGAIIGMSIGLLVLIILNDIQISKTLGVKTDMLKQGIKPFISSIIMGVAVYVTATITSLIVSNILGGYLSNLITIFISIGVGVIIYGIVIIVTKGIKKEDLEVFPARLRGKIPSRLYNKLD